MTGWQWFLCQLLISCFGLTWGEYLGCYRDADNNLMKGYSENLVLSLTPERCEDICASRGFAYAAVKSRVTCLCDQHKPSFRFKVEDRVCGAPCVGDSSRKCGGTEAVGLYSTSLVEKDDSGQPLSDNYIGCFKDDLTDRVLAGYSRKLNDNTPQKCKNICNRLGYLYAGLELGVECFCGDAHPSAQLLVNSSQCSTVCPGDSEFKCGNQLRVSVYETGITDVPVLGKKLGCFDDQDPRILTDYKIELATTNSPRRCMNLCRSLGYAYAGVEYAIECFCGNTFNANTTRDAADEECNSTCPGDIFDSCGANWKLQAFRTGLDDGEPVIKRLGCFPNNRQTLMSIAYRQDFARPVDADQCAKLCYQKGFYYSAVIFGIQCWCDYSGPPESLSLGTDDCPDSSVAVYDTGHHVPRHSYLGCFNEEQNIKVLDGFGHKKDHSLTPAKCAQMCFSKGYLYSAVRNKNECHCGDKLPRDRTRANDDDCSAPCSGDKLQRCGGTNKMSLYANGFSDISPLGKLIGCFKDEVRPRALDAHKTDLDKTNRPERCLNYCRQLGYKYAGTEYRMECYCGNSRPSSILDASDSDCNAECSGDSSETCGGNWRMAVYRTGFGSYIPDPVDVITPLTPQPSQGCEQSTTLVNGRPVCRGDVVFRDSFTASSIANHWKHAVKTADSPDYEFVTFTTNATNCFQSEGKLVITPTVIPHSEVQGGSISLEGCTGLAGTRECELSAFSYNILPPIRSARIHTRSSFSFRYGKVEIRAKLPAGDWLIPELWLLPKDHSYGSNYLSGKIRVAMSRGNRYLTCGGEDMGSSTLESGILVGPENNVMARSVVNRIADSWYAHTHNYTLVWTPDNLSFFVDGQDNQALLPPGGRLRELLGFGTGEDVSSWNTGSRIAPFDTDFYLSLGLSAGGFRDFQDNCISKNHPKPWKNSKLKAMLNFWLDRENWQSSWRQDHTSLIVEHVQVTAL